VTIATCIPPTRRTSFTNIVLGSFQVRAATLYIDFASDELFVRPQIDRRHLPAVSARPICTASGQARRPPNQDRQPFPGLRIFAF